VITPKVTGTRAMSDANMRPVAADVAT